MAGTAVRTVKVIIEGSAASLMGTLTTTAAAVKGLGKEFDELAVKNEASFKKITNAGLAVGGVMVGAFALMEKSAIGFDKQMSAVEAVMDRTGLSSQQFATQVSGMRTAAIKAGEDTAFTATEAAQAEEELAKAGISSADILSGGLKASLNLASAGTLSLADAAKYASQAMIEFNLHGQDAAHIADVLTAGANKSVTDVAGLGDALGQAGTVAHQAGMNLDEVVGVLALFSQHGLDGVEAGTTLKQMLLKLENPSDKAASLMQSLGLKVYDTNGAFVSASELAGNLQQALAGLTEQQRNAALAEIFGARAVRGATDLYNAGSVGVDNWTKAVNDSGIAQTTASTKLNNLSGDIKKVEGSLQAFAITATSSATPVLRGIAQGVEQATNDFAKMPGPMQAVFADTLLIGGGLITLTAGFLKVRGAIQNTLATLASGGPLSKGLGGVLGSLGKVIGIGSLVFAAGTLIYKGLNWAVDKRHDWDPTKRNIDDLTASLTALANTGKVGGYLEATWGKDLKKLQLEITSMHKVASGYSLIDPTGTNVAIANINEKMHNLATQGTTDFKALDTSLDGLVKNGAVSTANIAFADLQGTLMGFGMSMDEINSKFPTYTKDAANAAAGSSGMAKGIASASDQVNLMNEGLATAIDRGETLDSIFKELNGGATGYTQALIAYNQGLTGMNKTLKDNIKSLHGSKDALNLNTKAGQDNMTSILDQIDKAEKLAQAKFDETGSIDAASKTWDTYIGKVRAALIADGLTAKQADQLLGIYAKMPKLNATETTAPGLSNVLDQAHTLFDYLTKLNGKTVSFRVIEHDGVNTIIGSGQKFERWGGVYEHAAVGVLRDAHIARPVARGARYAYAEPQTQGEAFVPKRGNYGRSMSILSAAAGWYNASVVPGGPAGGVNVNLHISSDAGAARALVQQLKFTISNMGGVARALGP